MSEGKWTLEGYDTFDREWYAIGEFEGESEAKDAAQKKLVELESMQPSVDSGGESGIQDRVYLTDPDGRRQRVLRRRGQ